MWSKERNQTRKVTIRFKQSEYDAIEAATKETYSWNATVSRFLRAIIDEAMNKRRADKMAKEIAARSEELKTAATRSRKKK